MACSPDGIDENLFSSLSELTDIYVHSFSSSAVSWCSLVSDKVKVHLPPCYTKLDDDTCNNVNNEDDMKERLNLDEATPDTCSCKTNYAFNEINVCRACYELIDNCDVCSTSDTCSQCSVGYYVNDQDTCSQCIDNCDVCSDSDTCSQCSVGSYKNVDKCSKCIDNCDVCSDSNTCSQCSVGWKLDNNKCEQCDTGYYKDGNSCTSCSTTITGCSECSDSTTCTKCATGYYEDSNGNSVTCYPNCQTGNVANCNDGKCYLIGDEQVESNRKCSECNDGWKLNDGKCEPCADGYVEKYTIDEQNRIVSTGCVLKSDCQNEIDIDGYVFCLDDNYLDCTMVEEKDEKCDDYCWVRKNGEEEYECIKCLNEEYFTMNAEGECECNEIEFSFKYDDVDVKVCYPESTCTINVEHCDACVDVEDEDGKKQVCGQCAEGYSLQLVEEDEENMSTKCVEDGSIAILLALATLLMMIF